MQFHAGKGCHPAASSSRVSTVASGFLNSWGNAAATRLHAASFDLSDTIFTSEKNRRSRIEGVFATIDKSWSATVSQHRAYSIKHCKMLGPIQYSSGRANGWSDGTVVQMSWVAALCMKRCRHGTVWRHRRFVIPWYRLARC